MADKSNHQFDLAAALVGYRNGRRFRFRGNFLFNRISLAGARVLEVGCGTGAWAIWAALEGASKVVGIEPEAQGSSDHSLDACRENIEALGLQEHVEARGCTLQEMLLSRELFDVVIMYNVINHLDEDSVVHLHEDTNAVEHYVALLRQLRLHMAADGWVIAADCGRDNMWSRIGLRSPFIPSIEWQKHQDPKTWLKVFEQAGFRAFDLRWSPLQPLPMLTGNWLMEYLTCSHFVLRLRPTTASLSQDISKRP